MSVSCTESTEADRDRIAPGTPYAGRVVFPGCSSTRDHASRSANIYGCTRPAAQPLPTGVSSAVSEGCRVLCRPKRRVPLSLP